MRINRTDLETVVGNINLYTKEHYRLYNANGCYSFVVSTNDGCLYEGCFGTLMGLSAREMYWYLHGVYHTITTLQRDGIEKVLKTKN